MMRRMIGTGFGFGPELSSIASEVESGGQTGIYHSACILNKLYSTVTFVRANVHGTRVARRRGLRAVQGKELFIQRETPKCCPQNYTCPEILIQSVPAKQKAKLTSHPPQQRQHLALAAPSEAHLPIRNPLPEPPQSPDSPHTNPLLPPPHPLLPGLHLSPPRRPDKSPQPVLDALPLDGPPPRHKRRGHRHRCRAGRLGRTPTAVRHTLGREHAARDEGLWRGSAGQAMLEADGHEGAGELSGDDRGLGHEDGAADEVRERGARGRGEQGREDGSGAAEAEAVEDWGEGEASEEVGRLGGGC